MKNSLSKVSVSKTEILNFEPKFIDEVLEIQTETDLSFWSKNDYLGEHERTDSIFKIARTADKKIIGFALLRLLISNSDTANTSFDSSEILNIAVRRSTQNSGVGQMIFDDILRELEERNVREIWLEVRASNSKAIAFYQKNNFEKQSERKNYYSNPTENAFIFRRLINS
jgi:ribosomal-protein-alanine N-acetyltransferase